MNSLGNTRIAFIESMAEIVEQDPNAVLVCADSVLVVKGKPFTEKYPGKFFDVGIAEQNAVACAAAVATARVIKDEKLLENATHMGARLMDHLRAVQEEYPAIGDVRGLGLMIATEFTAGDGSPATTEAKAVAEACLERGLMLLTCGTWNNTVRWIPPLIVTSDQIDEAVEVFRAALAQVRRETQEC